LALGVLAFGGARIAAAASEQQQGAQVLREVHTGKASGANLTGAQYKHVGQYMMGRALGSSDRYEATDSLMDRTMGQSASDQMYKYMGERYLGKNVSPNSGYAPYYDWMANMMSRYSGSWAGMMGGYMMGAYRSLSGRGSGASGGHMGGMMGYNYTGSRNAADTGMSTGTIIAVVLGAIAVVGLLAILLLGMTRRRAPKAGAA
jgi:hypothetical protein